MIKTIGFLQLMRPANIVTSVADVLAGIAISGFLFTSGQASGNFMTILLLCISTIGLYGGGVVFNDVFDTALDRIERPERPIPKGIVTIKEATALGVGLLLIGIIAATLVSLLSGLIAMSIAIAALVYNKWSKHHYIAGPLNMGLCRGLNLLLGISILPATLSTTWFLAFIPIIYIAAITMVSRGEVHGGSKRVLYFAALLYGLVIAAILMLSFLQGTVVWTILFLLFFGWMIFSKLFIAVQNPLPQNIGKAVKAGVIALVLMNAAWAAAFGTLYLAFFIVLLLPLSLWLAKKFAVT